ncbi:TonB-dependent receptor plug domain-containing protein [Collimonas pratensis]|uniref:TonB dependent receptor family protein n=1 Tax=Collimonas pratensis TaxID=279113 RepID=A0ABN4MDN8_9BURK|nr:TonB-dependent receptor [Collimonas pratensis]AMP14724.1 tonB dependent receptor family protein [Collimonas pratensis]
MKKKFLASAIAAICLAHNPLAFGADQTDTTPTDNLQRITVTGSNISRINKEGPTAVEIIKRDEIEKSGASTVVELLGKLPSVSVQLTGNDGNSFAGGAASVGLRGLDAKYTLILLNGRRLANYGFANGAENTFVDLNNLPLAAIESVEILRDGASAIYGSDAVAGVINFKTKRNYQGYETSANLGTNEKGDGGTASASLTAGWGDLDKDGQNLLLTVDVFRRNPLWSDKHDATSSRDFRRFGGSDQRSVDRYLGTLRDFSSGEPGFPIPGCRGSVEVSSATGDLSCFNNQQKQLSPKILRGGISAIFTKKLSGQDELFAEAGFNHSESSIQTGLPSFDSAFIGNTAGSTNPGLANLPGPSPDGSLQGFTPGDRLQVFRGIYEAAPSQVKITSDTIRLVGGWRGLIGNWDSEGAISLNQNRIKEVDSNAVLKDVSSASLQSGLLGNGGYDPFAYWNPASVVNPMLTTTERVAVSRLETLDWKMSAPELFSFNGGPVGFAWGAQASHESIDDHPDPRNVASNIVNSGATASNASRSLYSLYGEFNVPLMKQVEMQLALRGDHYSDFGNSFNPKIALAWRPSKEILLRGSATTSFKAPTLPELHSTTAAYVGTAIADFARCGPLGYVGPNCSYYPKLSIVGNPDLKAEKANNYSLGIVLQPLKGLSASVDWYAIKQRNTIQSLDPQYIVDNEDIIPGYAALVGRDPRNPALEKLHPGLNKGRLNTITTPYINVGKTDIQGLDIDISYELPLAGWGKLKFREVNDYTLSYKQSTTPGGAPASKLDSISHPRWSNSFRMAYEYASTEVALTARTQSSTLNIDDPTHTQDPAITNSRIPSFTAWDLNLNTKVSKNLTLNFGVNNVFDKAPVYASTSYLNDFVQGQNDLIGRYIYANMRYQFQ